MGGSGGAKNSRGFVVFLIDQNLSRRLPDLLAEAFPGATHVVTAGLERSPDIEVWRVAGERGLILLTKDRDFEALALTRGAPPKVLVIAIGNCTTRDAADLLLGHRAVIEAFQVSDESLLVLGR